METNIGVWMFEVSRPIPRRGLSARKRVILRPGVCLHRNTTDRIPNEARTLKGLQKEAAMREACKYTLVRGDCFLKKLLLLFFYKDRIEIDVRFVVDILH